MDPLLVLEMLEDTSSSIVKTRILKENRSLELDYILDASLNFKRKFYIKKFDTGETEGNATFAQFKALLELLEARTITGNAALKATEDFFAACDLLEKKWYSRILRKDLRCGIDISICKKAGIDIPEFTVMLAKDGKECKNIEAIVKDGVYVSPKLDGYRCIAICSQGDVVLYSRNGSQYGNFPSIITELEKWCQDSSFILDGEIMSDNFNNMQQSAFASVRGTTVGDVKYHVFGFIPTEEWENDKFSMPTKQRLDNLSKLFERNKSELIVKVPQKLTYMVSTISEYEMEYMTLGYEGAMVLPNIPYYKGRKSNKLMKFKTMLSQDCTVIGVYEGTGKYSGSLGGLQLLQENNITRCDVGSGFTDEERTYIWANSSDVIGRKAEIKYQEVTPDGVLRFPIFIRWRDTGPNTGKI